jgi:hypothetical protein
MDPLVQVAQGGVDGAVAGDAGHGGQAGGADADGEMAGTRAVIAGVARVAVAFVDYLQLGRLKGACQAIFNLCINFHFALTPSICRQND